MKLLGILKGMPRWALFSAVPIAAFVVATAVALNTGGGDDQTTTETSLPQQLTVQNLDPAPTPSPAPTAEPTPEPVANRADCDAIRGTAYLSAEERDWYQVNCRTQTATAAPAASGGGAPAGPPTGGGPVAASEFHLGDRLLIPSIGVNAVVTGAVVGPSGVMPDPVGYFNAVWYDFRNFPGLGGYTDGNLVLAGHVDCARCHNGSPGAAIFYNVRTLPAGARIEYRTGSGEVHVYAVRSVTAYAPGSNWGAILSSSAADLTIITCGGTWDPVARDYSHRFTVYADKVG